MISALTGVHFTLLLAKFAGVLIEILHGIFYVPFEADIVRMSL